ncbi:integrase core domain-containing protein [Chryseobacterium lactis]|uniref:integrase core domain-containing protein n=1 Tax=Chryseobacterium lactis TaxID=1241981 RepID=UPI0016295EE1|nr:integrase core domain-containing protein [Chryseobacterium lactis]
MVEINDIPVGTIPFSSIATVTTIDNLNVTGDFVIEILNPNTGQRMAIDDLTWTCYSTLGVNESSNSVPGIKLVQKLKELITYRPKPKSIRTDNCPEFLSKVFVDFCKGNNIDLQYIQPGKPAQNAYIERLNRTFREDVLDAYLFGSLMEVNAIAYEWQIDYNGNHPHKSLNGLSPWLYAKEYLGK